MTSDQLVGITCGGAIAVAAFFIKMWMNAQRENHTDLQKGLDKKQDKETCNMLNKHHHQHGNSGTAGEVLYDERDR
jgi:hypothetical protein